jgi:hypothetical protein
MASSKPKEDLLPSAAQRSSGPLATSSLALSAVAIDSRDGEYILQEGGKQALRMRVHAEKTAYAINQAGRLQSHAIHVFSESCDEIDRTAAGARNGPSNGYVETLSHLQKDQMAEQMMDLYDAGMGMIKAEVLKSLPTAAPKEERRGWAARLLTGE